MRLHYAAAMHGDHQWGRWLLYGKHAVSTPCVFAHFPPARSSGGHHDKPSGQAKGAPNFGRTTAAVRRGRQRAESVIILDRSRGRSFHQLAIATAPRDCANAIAVQLRGATRCYIRDPDGYIIEVGQNRSRAMQAGRHLRLDGAPPHPGRCHFSFCGSLVACRGLELGGVVDIPQNLGYAMRPGTCSRQNADHGILGGCALYRARRGCSSMVEQKPSKLMTRVRFPSPAPIVSITYRRSA